jgi:vancomycin resistance protein VanJ
VRDRNRQTGVLVLAADAFTIWWAMYLALHALSGDALWPVSTFHYVVHPFAWAIIFVLPFALVRRRWLAALALTGVAGWYLVTWLPQWLPPPAAVLLEEETIVRVMTFNIGNGLASADTLLPAIRAVEADIIGLQEVTAGQAEALTAALAGEYPFHVLHGLGIPGKGLLSRFPLIEAEMVEYHPGRPDLMAVVDVNGHAVRVVVAHPLPPRIHRTGFFFNENTRLQFARLVDQLDSGKPTVMLGDFNMTYLHDFHRMLRDAGLSDAFREVGQGFGFTLPARIQQLPALPFIRVDYIWHSEHFRPLAAFVGPDGGSDHLPVIAELLVPGAG